MSTTVVPPPNTPVQSQPTYPASLPAHQMPYAVPRATVGMSVVWYPFGEQHNPGMPGLVVEVGNRTLSLTVFLPNKGNVMYKDGVRHVGDPAAKAEEFKTSGCWDYSEQTKELMKLRSEVEALRAVIS